MRESAPGDSWLDESITDHTQAVRACQEQLVEGYNQLVGEVMARNVQRAKKDDEWRQDVPPWYPLDVPNRKQIVRGVKDTGLISGLRKFFGQ